MLLVNSSIVNLPSLLRSAVEKSWRSTTASHSALVTTPSLFAFDRPSAQKIAVAKDIGEDFSQIVHRHSVKDESGPGIRFSSPLLRPPAEKEKANPTHQAKAASDFMIALRSSRAVAEPARATL